MRNPSRRGYFATGIALAALCASILIHAQQSGGRKIEVLLFGNEGDVHSLEKAATPFVPEVAKEAINVSLTTSFADLNPSKLAKYDVAMIYGNNEPLTAQQEKALSDFVASGRGLVAVHTAGVRVAGGDVDRRANGTFTAAITRPEHPVMQTLGTFEAADETTVHKNLAADRTVLMDRDEGGRREAVAWVRNQGRGRVFYAAYGHDEKTWKLSEFQALLRNAIVWAAGDAVKAEWEKFELPTITRRSSSQVPNYERRSPPPKYQLPLSPADSMKLMQVPPGFEVQLFAAEPDIVKPITMAWDERGRLWVCESVDYPNDIHPGEPGRDRIKILEDTNGDGRADKFTIFAEGLNIPTGLTFYNGGVIVAQVPDMLYLKDTNGDDKADTRVVLHTGWGIRDTHSGPSNLRWGFDNRVWGSVGYSGFQGKSGDTTLSFPQGLWRMRPDGTGLEQTATFSNNTWGLGFGETFDIFGSTANNTHAVYVGVPNRFSADVKGLPVRAGSKKIDGHYAMAPITAGVRQVDVFAGYTAAAGFNLYTARTYPKDYWNRIAFVNEPTGRIVHQAVLEKQGAGYVEKDGFNLLASTDEWFAPVVAEVGPDGNVWVADFYNFIVQHNPTPVGFQNGKGNAYVNPLRDQKHGRIYRVVYKGAPAHKPLSLSKDRPADLLAALSNDSLAWRLHAQRLLVERGQKDVAPQLYALARNRRVDELGLNPAAVHALWTLEGLGMLDGSTAAATAVAVEALKHPAAGVRKAAVQALPATEATLKEVRAAGVLNDPDPFTRLAAVLLLARLAPSDEIGGLVYQTAKLPAVDKDEWLSLAAYDAAARHRAGFFKAQSAEMGATAFRALAEKVKVEEETPQQPQTGGRGGPALTGMSMSPVPDKLLHAYVEDIVGPVKRPPPPTAGFGGAPGGGRGFGQVIAGRSGRGATLGAPLEIEISTVKEEMKYTIEAFTVKPGQYVRITLKNPDEMQHNMVFVRPGTVEAVGALVTSMAKDTDAADRDYIPPTPDVLVWTKLVDPGQSVTLEFIAPTATGDYPYMCTFPGHWKTMRGMMKVAQ